MRIAPLTPMRRLSGDFIFLRQTSDDDYGRWLIELLPRIAVAAQFCDLSRFKVVVSHTSPAMEAVIRDSLRLFGLRPEQIVPVGARPTFFQRLVYPLPIASGACSKSPRAIEVLEYLPARFAGGAAAPRRIYVSGGPPAADAAALELLGPLGFTALNPGPMSFAEQVRAFSQAETVIGRCGGGLANAVFAPRGVRILALAPPGSDEEYFADLSDLKQGRFASFDLGAAGVPLDGAALKTLLDDVLS